MNTFRNKFIARFLIVLLTISLGTVIASPAARAEGNTVKYAHWLLRHLPNSSLPEVRRAVYLASEDDANSFEEFLILFQNELETLAGEVDQSDADKARNGTTNRLLQELRFMFTRFVGEALLVRYEVAASRKCISATQRIGFGDVSADRVHATVQDGSILETGVDLCVGEISTMFLRSAAQPLGP